MLNYKSNVIMLTLCGFQTETGEMLIIGYKRQENPLKDGHTL